MYLLITTPLSRFRRLYLCFALRGGTEYFSIISFFFFTFVFLDSISHFTRALVRSYLRVISIFLAYLLITMQLSRFSRLSLSVLCSGKRVSFRLLPCLRSHARSLEIKLHSSLWVLKREKKSTKFYQKHGYSRFSAVCNSLILLPLGEEHNVFI